MRRLFLPILVLLLISCTNPKQDSYPSFIEVSLQNKSGQAPFLGNFSQVTIPDTTSEMSPLYERPVNIPEMNKLLGVGVFNTDFMQLIYQGYHQGLVDSAFASRWFDSLAEDDNEEFSKKPLDVQISVAFGRNEDGDVLITVDEQNDEDFSNDSAFVVTKSDSINFINNRRKFKEILPKAMPTVDFYNGEEIETVKIPVLLHPYAMSNTLVWTILNHKKGQITVNKKEYHFYVKSSFTNLRYIDKLVGIIKSDSLIEGPQNYVPREQELKINQTVLFDSVKYEIAEVRQSDNKLILKKQAEDHEIAGTQLGATAPEIQAKSFRDSAEVSLSDSKFTLLDFWGTWCGPCLTETPFLRDAYNIYRDKGFDLIGVALDTEDDLRSYIEKEKLSWPQIRIDEDAEIVQKYGVVGYPTSFLINPKGKIIKKEQALRSYRLHKTLAEQLGTGTEYFYEKILSGNVIIEVEDKAEWLMIEGEIADGLKLPLYNTASNWKRGFNLEPGKYAYTLSGVVESNIKKTGTVTVTGSDNEVIKLGLE